MTNDALTSNIKPCGACLGAFITNIDLTAKILNDEKESLRNALDQYQVIFFPDQKLTPNHQKSVTE